MKIDRLKTGFIYTIDHISADGRLISSEKIPNLMPDVGRDYMLSASLLGASQFSTWYIGLYGSNYTPVADTTMVEIISTATEITTYDAAVRATLVPDALADGVYANSVSKAAFVFTSAAATVRGGFIVSDSTQGSNTGLLLSAVLFPSPKILALGETLNITAGITFTTT